jgi:DDE superfamily endonuclease
MPAIVEFPTIVQHAVEEFGVVFANEPERRHFAEYLTGLFVAERKNVSGINSEFAVTTDQSCLNRWITEVEWDEKELNERRLAWLQHDPSTRYSAQGVIAIDDTLIDHEGKLIEDVGWFWDHADKRHLIAHDYLIANYVCTSGKHYGLEFRRFRKRDARRGRRSSPNAKAACRRPVRKSSGLRLSRATRSDSRSLWMGWWSGRSRAISPSIATSPTPRSSTTSTALGVATWGT